jgi:YggT family protein
MALLNIISLIFQVFTLMLFARIIGSWLPELNQYRFMQFISFYTDPYLDLFRKIIPPLGMIDISPIFAFLGLGVIEYVLKLMVINIFR